jgi:hypothetical protein
MSFKLGSSLALSPMPVEVELIGADSNHLSTTRRR